MSRPRPAKRRRVSSPENGGYDSSSSDQSTSNKWHLEQEYEQRPRLQKGKVKRERLPIRTEEGWVEQQTEKDESGEDDADSFLKSGSDDSDGAAQEAEGGPEEEAPPKSAQEVILEAKEELARLAGLINEDPEEHMGALRSMAEHMSSPNNTVKELALLSLCAVYKDIIPGYRIRPLSEDDRSAKTSKDVRKLRNHEQSLVAGYQHYVRNLARLAREGKSASEESASRLTTVAISCVCSLLTAVPHFNFRGDIIRIVVGKLSTRNVDKNHQKCRETLEVLFRDDEGGIASLDAVTQITKMMKAKNYNIDESVLNTFLHLRLLSEFSHKGSQKRIDRDDELPKIRKGKWKKEFRTKREKKVARENKSIEKEMREADAAVSHEERDRMQAETLKLVFIAYFRILKARTPKLMGAVLEGLAKYSHLINQDFFGDILEALRDLIRQAEAADSEQNGGDGPPDLDAGQEAAVSNATRHSLLCVITAFALLEGQDASRAASTLHLDLSFFITHLYRTLYHAALNPDLELSAKSLRLPDPGSSSHDPDAPTAPPAKVNVQTTAALLIRSLTSVLIPPHAPRAIPPVRLAAFTKQLLTCALHLPEKSCAAVLGLVREVARAHGRKVAALWASEERRGDGMFDALRGEVEGSNPFASTVWEGELLRMHYCPAIREAVGGIEKNVMEAL